MQKPSAAREKFPHFYPILDAGSLARYGLDLFATAEALKRAGVEILQYRDKSASAEMMLFNAKRLREICEGSVRLVINDDAVIAHKAGLHSVHLGQGDGPLTAARQVLGEGSWIGVSTHSEAQIALADASTADYVAIGPVYATGTKLDASPVVGVEGVRRARMLTSKPLVAIGGITLELARSVRDAGADSVAVISDLYSGGSLGAVLKRSQDFIALLK